MDYRLELGSSVEMTVAMMPVELGRGYCEETKHSPLMVEAVVSVARRLLVVWAAIRQKNQTNSISTLRMLYL